MLQPSPSGQTVLSSAFGKLSRNSPSSGSKSKVELHPKYSERVLEQYPFFQKNIGDDLKYLKKARKATDAEWRLLARYDKTKKLITDVNLNESKLERVGYKKHGHIKITEE